jgi:predicted ATP-grasp superfamily ATP-dependent carboligase
MCGAVVVGGDLNALGVVRSLAAGNVPTVIVGSDSKGDAMRSRYGRKMIVTETGGQSLLDALAALATQFSQPPVLFLTEEKSVRTVSEYRHLVLPGFRIQLPDHERLMALMHKQGFQELAEACGAAIPKTLHLRSREDLAKLGEMTFPCVLKPAKKDYDYGARFKKAYVVQSAQEVGKLYTEIAPVLSDMVVQQWIDGDDADIYFTLQYVGADGATVSTFTGRKIRSWPPRIGGTASCTAAWNEAPELDAMTAKFFTQVGFTGMGSMEYKRDRRDGKFYMIEPTVARTDFQEEVATLNGVNIPLAAYYHELGLPPVASVPTPIARTWREPISDRWAAQSHGAAPDDRSRGDRKVDAYWRMSDPMPWLYMMRDRLAITQRVEKWKKKLG